MKLKLQTTANFILVYRQVIKMLQIFSNAVIQYLVDQKGALAGQFLRKRKNISKNNVSFAERTTTVNNTRGNGILACSNDV